jgi:HAD superfamily hydrolase (TIGR01509 family)
MLVIFDCDGVLVDSERLSHEVLREMILELGVAISLDEAVDRFMGTSMPVCMQRLEALLGRAAPDDFLAQLSARTRHAFEGALSAVPGVEQVLDALQARSPRGQPPFCVASNGNHAKVNFTLGLTGLLPRFAGRIFTADDVVHPKPAPDLFLHAAQTLGVPPALTTVVEDTATGVAAAKAAGMRAIGYGAMTPAARLRAAGADEVVQTMAQVRQLVAA